MRPEARSAVQCSVAARMPAPSLSAHVCVRLTFVCSAATGMAIMASTTQTAATATATATPVGLAPRVCCMAAAAAGGGASTAMMMGRRSGRVYDACAAAGCCSGLARGWRMAVCVRATDGPTCHAAFEPTNGTTRCTANISHEIKIKYEAYRK